MGTHQPFAAPALMRAAKPCLPPFEAPAFLVILDQAGFLDGPPCVLSGGPGEERSGRLWRWSKTDTTV